MSDNDTTTGQDCPRCLGCGLLADSDDREPWTMWKDLPPGSDLAVRLGLVSPVECDECGGSGRASMPTSTTLPIELAPNGEFVLTWHPLDPDADPVEVPLNHHWVFPGDVAGEFRLSTREVPEVPGA